MVGKCETDSQKVNKKYSLSTYLKPKEILKGERYSEPQRRSIKCALEEIATTRKTGKISEGRKVNILRDLLKFSPEVAAEACHIYVSKGCAADGKRENYLMGIARQLVRQQEQQQKEKMRKMCVDPAQEWYDRGHVYSREYLEELAGRLNLDGEQLELLKRAKQARPRWTLKRGKVEKKTDEDVRVPTRVFS